MVRTTVVTSHQLYSLTWSWAVSLLEKADPEEYAHYLAGEWEGSRTTCQGFKPDLGNSAVRHYRGASENVAMAEL
jgi:hypothetical protein